MHIWVRERHTLFEVAAPCNLLLAIKQYSVNESNTLVDLTPALGRDRSKYFQTGESELQLQTFPNFRMFGFRPSQGKHINLHRDARL